MNKGLIITSGVFLACFCIGATIGLCVVKYAAKGHDSPTKIEYITEPVDPLTEMLLDLEVYSDVEVNDSTAFGAMIEFEIQHPHIVLAQMKIESGNYGSSIAKNNNNYFGMRQPSTRITVSLGSRNGYARYRSWAYSILDYALWQRQYAWGLTEDQYLAKLGRAYAEDPNYVAKVKKLSKNLEN